jgi:maltooligosyltrehalose trehalohydrolase
LPLYSPYYFSETRENPWGKSLNFDGPKSSMVRQFFIENALHWIHQYHFDGLRLDATHAIQDEDPRHFVAQLATRVRESAPERMVYVIAEDHRNWAHIIRPEGEGGWGLDGVWADDFHHKVRVTLAGDSEGYFSDFKPSMPELAGILNQGWQFTGQYSEYLKKHRGTETAGVPAQRFVFCLQNHDQIGNRAQGERLHHQVDLSAYRAASVLLLTAPATPLLFMGQEWACSSPFLYFTDHPAELGRLVTEGRRNEFRHFSAFSDPATRQRIPDPQAEKTFELSRLKWDEINQEPYASLHRLYQRLLAMRIAEPAIQNDQSTAFAVGEKSLLIRRDAKVGAGLIIVVHMEGSAEVDLTNRDGLQGLDIARCQLVLSTEDLPFATDPHPPSIEYAALGPKIDFVRPGALIFSVWPTRESVS